MKIKEGPYPSYTEPDKISSEQTHLHILIISNQNYRAWQDSNLQSPDPKSGALSIRPQAHTSCSPYDISHNYSYFTFDWNISNI